MANANGDSKGLSASGDSKSLINAELLAAREKAFTEVQNACKRYIYTAIELVNLFNFKFQRGWGFKKTTVYSLALLNTRYFEKFAVYSILSFISYC